MKYILSGVTLLLALISGNAVAQGNVEDNKIMSRLNTGEYAGPYFANDQNNPLVLLTDGDNTFKIGKSSLLNEIEESWIENMEVLKGAKATQLYGNEGANGVVIITLKEGVEATKLYLDRVKKEQSEQ
ncbi:hypothetical protein [Pontibacter populi]|uniref:TonB-dependent receptor plug domain-containing protein n=1 Tax=Pontibacter populi TaxID=890055 RepID=A0ABV1RPY7_9BACT